MIFSILWNAKKINIQTKACQHIISFFLQKWKRPSRTFNPNRAGIVFFDTLFSKTVFKPCCLNQKFFVTTCYGSHFFLRIFFNYIRISINSLFRCENGVFIKKKHVIACTSGYNTVCVRLLSKHQILWRLRLALCFKIHFVAVGGEGGRYSQRQYSVAFFDLYFRH